jgi:3-oxoacyl-(acyl-carrier-protein) synthase
MVAREDEDSGNGRTVTRALDRHASDEDDLDVAATHGTGV